MQTARLTFSKSLAICGVIAATFLTTGCQPKEKPKKIVLRTPRLATVVVVDMLPNSFLDRYGANLGEGGFKRLINQGAWMTNAHVGYGSANTAAGHATISTGRYPSDHGIVAYQWHKSELSKPISATTDHYYTMLGYTRDRVGDGASPSQMVGATLGGQLKQKHGADAKVWAVSLKELSAVLLGGESADGAVWWEAVDGQFLSSNYYYDQLPDWVKQLNDDRVVDNHFGDPWERLLPIDAYKNCDADDVPYERGQATLWLNSMPKTLGSTMPTPNRIYYRQLRTSPFGNELVFEAAKRAIVNESLGADDTPDLLMLSLSSTDYCGYLFGPESHEMADMFYRTDKQLADWFNFLDAHVGLENCLVAVVGDHGACPTPEYAQGFGKDAGRIDLNAIVDSIESALVTEFGSPGDGFYYLSFIDLPWIYLNTHLMGLKELDVDRANEIVVQTLKGFRGVEHAIACSQLAGKPESELSDIERLVKRSYFPERSGSVYIGLRSGWYPSNVTSGPLTANDYDAHIPMWMMGQGIRATTVSDDVEFPDLSATLGRFLKLPPVENQRGKVLKSILEK